MSSVQNGHTLTLDNLNPGIKAMKYAIRGALFMRSIEIESELEQGVPKPFTEVIKAHTGDCQAMGQIPITFIRQVIAMVSYPKLLEDPQFPDDAKERARLILKHCKGGSIGAYSEHTGIEIIKKHVAEYITKRDEGVPCDWRNVILTAGITTAIKTVLKLFVSQANGKKPGVLVPVPQFPMYSATLVELGMEQCKYYLDESNNWSLDIEELQRAVLEARKTSVPKALVIINPGNPTGQVLTRKNIEEIIKFAYKAKLFLLADEVYQDNVYDENSKFYSFKKVMTEMGKPYSSMELISFMSCSKGYMGECGFRGGYMEVINMHPKVIPMCIKLLSTLTCPNTLGQTVLETVVNPPKKGEPSYAQWAKEKQDILGSLSLKAKIVAESLNSIEGFKCNPVQGAMYAFPQITIPQKAIEEAERLGLHPDAFYSYELLENTGVCVTPGSGFDQKAGTFHFRTTILPEFEQLQRMLEKLKEFHEWFLKKYS